MSREGSRRGALPSAKETIEKLERTVNGGKFYEAQQMYKCFANRYVSANNYDDALDILQSGASVQLKFGQIICGAELAVLFVETLAKGKVPCNRRSLDRVKKIFKDFPQISMPQQLGDDDNDIQKISEALTEAKSRVESCSSFLKAAIKWSAEFGGHKFGSPELHTMLAEYIYTESPEVDMGRISVYFIRGNNPGKLASILVNFMGKCYPGEDDLAIARAVLLYLSQGNLRDANYIMDEIKRQLEAEQLEIPQTDLMQFVVFLLQTLERDALPLFRMLRQKYKQSIEREASFEELLDEIGEKFYGVRRRSGLQGIFGDFFKMMGGEI